MKPFTPWKKHLRRDLSHYTQHLLELHVLPCQWCLGPHGVPLPAAPYAVPSTRKQLRVALREVRRALFERCLSACETCLHPHDLLFLGGKFLPVLGLLLAAAYENKETGAILAVRPPGRHATILHRAHFRGMVLREGLDWNSGFVDGHGTFLTREQAARFAFERGMILKERLVERGQPPDECPDILFSEDVW